jgi:hypothetical protein
MHRAKPPVFTIHRLALILLAISAGWNLVFLVTKLVEQWFSMERLTAVGMSVGLWSLFIWKVWTRPRSWGKGVGIALIVIVLGQVFLLYTIVKHLKSIGQEAEFVPSLLRYLPYQILLLVTSVVCLLLRKRSAVHEVAAGEEQK